MFCNIILFYLLSIVLYLECSSGEIEINNNTLISEELNESTTTMSSLYINHGQDIVTRDDNSKTPLINAAGQPNSLSMIKFFIKENVDVNLSDEEGRTALFESAKTGQSDSFEYLLEHGADHNIKDIRGRTVAHIAASNGHSDIIEKLIEKLTNGSDILNSKDHWGRTPSYYAALNGSLNCLKLLDKFDLRNDDNVVVAGVIGGNLEVVRHLIDVINENYIKVTNESGMSLLQIACDNKHYDIAKYLIEEGSDVNVKDSFGRNLLHISSIVGSSDLVSLLINKVDINAKDDFGNTPLHYASQNDDESVTSVLLDGEAQIDLKNKDDKSPAAIATENNCLHSLTVLINRGQSINGINSSGRTLAHIAALFGAESSLKLLIAMGIDYNRTDNTGNQPLHYSVSHIKSLKTLLEAGVDIDNLNSDGKTALQLAADSININSVKCLIKYGAQPEKVKFTSNPGDRYFAYVRNPTVATKRDVFTFLTKVLQGEVLAENVEC